MKYVPPLGEAPNTPYIDGNPAAGIEGSIVPAASIEHDQREIVAVIEGAGLTPDSADLTQLTQAIAKFITDAIAAIPAVPNATTTKRGIVELATNAEAPTGSDTVRAVTPAGLAAAIAALGIDPNDFVKKIGDTMTGGLTIANGAPLLLLEETDAPASHKRARILLNTENFHIQTLRGDGTFVSQDYVIFRNASGATLHQWRVANVERMSLGASGPTITADFPLVTLVESNGDSAFNQTRIGQNADQFVLQTRDGAGTFVSNDYVMVKDVAGAISHRWATNGVVRMFLDGAGRLGLGTTSPLEDLHVVAPSPVLRLSDRDALTDTEVMARIEFYRGASTKRVGQIGFPNPGHEHMNIQNETAGGDIRFIFGSSVAGRFDADGGAVVGTPTGGSQGTGSLNAEGLFVNGQSVLTEVDKSLTQNGYLTLNNGLIIQWGRETGITKPGKTATFPMSFPNAVLTFVASNDFEAASASVVSTRVLSLSQFRLWVNNKGTIPVRWIAIGC